MVSGPHDRKYLSQDVTPGHDPTDGLIVPLADFDVSKEGRPDLPHDLGSGVTIVRCGQEFREKLTDMVRRAQNSGQIDIVQYFPHIDHSSYCFVFGPEWRNCVPLLALISRTARLLWGMYSVGVFSILDVKAIGFNDSSEIKDFVLSEEPRSVLFDKGLVPVVEYIDGLTEHNFVEQHTMCREFELQRFPTYLNKVLSIYSKQGKNNRVGGAIDYFHNSFITPQIDLKVVSLSASMECLFNPGSTEILEKLAQRVAWYFGENAERRLYIYERIKKDFYRLRSKIVHGSTGVDVDLSLFASWRDLIRIILCRVLDSLQSIRQRPGGCIQCE